MAQVASPMVATHNQGEYEMITEKAEDVRDRDAPTRRYKTPTFKHRQFAVIAAIIAGMADCIDNDRRKVALNFAATLAGTNPRFDRSRFMRACKVLP